MRPCLILPLLGTLYLGACAAVPLDGQDQASYSYDSSEYSRIAQQLSTEAGLPGVGDSAIRLQVSGYQAWEDRLRLVQLADQSLDIQYFSWHQDTSGSVLMSHVVDAADRGVRVRLLLDDMMAIDQQALAKIDAHPNIAVRLFNPFATQRVDLLLRPFEWLAKERLNVRMHNKLFLVDGLVGMVGGRNIRDRYFWIDPAYNHRDLDAVVIGAVLPVMQSSFDDYWNSRWAVPIPALEPAVKPRKARRYYKALRKLREQQEVVDQFAAMQLVELPEYRVNYAMRRAHIEFIADPPSKVQSRETTHFDFLDALIEEHVEERLLIGMAYVVESDAVQQQLSNVAGRGASISVLTNSMVSIDFPAAFSGYVDIRGTLLDLGAQVYEFAADASYVSPQCPDGCAGTHMGYHCKLLVLDDDIAYVGSMNYDPRSIDFNTEAGLLIYSPAVAGDVAALFFEDSDGRNSWQVQQSSPMRWTRPGASGDLERRDSEPDASVLNKLGVGFWGMVPLGDQY